MKMTKIITAINNPELNKELKRENNIELMCKDIQYKEGILEMLEENVTVDYIIIDEKLPGEINIEELIEKIIEINEKIKIIIAIKKENEKNNNYNNKNIITIIYENKINLNKLKNYKKDTKEINVKKIKKEKNNKIINKTKIISLLGEQKVGKTMTMLNIAYLLKDKDYKILIIELNKESSDIKTILKFNKKKNKKRKIKIKNKYLIIKGKFNKKYINNKIIKKMIFKINKNIDMISYNKLIKYNNIEKIKNNYNFILIEINYKKLNRKILNNSNKNILIINPNLIGIKNSKKIIEKFNKNKIEILINNYNKFSIEENILKKIFSKNRIIGKIKYKQEYEMFINRNFRGKFFSTKIHKQEIENIIKKIV